MELLVPAAMTTAAALWEPQARDWVTVTSVRSGECQCEYEYAPLSKLNSLIRNIRHLQHFSLCD
uniref:HDC15447 n=1 Tax=Drosophila melanogaster TaxID=7227 RepID=Q6IJA4_DROME|nr:TPA_inf: HDC15447 [Drosophila melanogaster]